ncbi:MAG: glycosyltransferase family 2 protein [Methylococcales bacterium]|jgi:succinoglycan biosynthesis protein ExoM|nr:glycosyltransferase family 2 protein [Methylococcales bacterium]MBT5231061.1 glycosyltransferase family 2 protein [Methylococcales bacterium]
MPKATISIITCRRPEGLARLLESLVLQQVISGDELDIAVVDNACEAATKQVVTEFQSRSPFPIKYYEEPEPGIVAARNKCVEQFLSSDSDCLIFIDDDEWTQDNHWAHNLLQAQKKYQADVVASHVISKGEAGTPSWATELLYGDNQLKEGQVLTTFYTGNLLITRTVLEAIKPAFDYRFAMTGASDYHFALKCQKQGFAAFYTDAPAIEEFPKSRATIKWFAKRGFRSGIGHTRSHLFEDAMVKAVGLCLILAGIRFVRGIAYLILGLVTLNKLRFVDGIFRLSSFAGSLAGFFGVRHNEYETIYGK